jgi:hypothetical protein
LDIRKKQQQKIPENYITIIFITYSLCSILYYSEIKGNARIYRTYGEYGNKCICGNQNRGDHLGDLAKRTVVNMVMGLFLLLKFYVALDGVWCTGY